MTTIIVSGDEHDNKLSPFIQRCVKLSKLSQAWQKCPESEITKGQLHPHIPSRGMLYHIATSKWNPHSYLFVNNGGKETMTNNVELSKATVFSDSTGYIDENINMESDLVI